MKKNRMGNIGLSVFLTILIAITGAVFLNSVSARQTFKAENMRSMIGKTVTDSVESRINYLDLAAYIDSGKITESIESSEFNELLDRYSEYISEYMLTKNAEKEITDSDLAAFITPYIDDWTSALSATGLFTDSMKQEIVDTLVDTLANVFVSLDEYLSESLLSTLQLALSPMVRNLSLILTVVFAVLLFFSATPRRLFGFLGAAAAVAGGMSLLVGQWIYSFFFDMFNNPLLSYLLQDYSDRISSLSIVVAVVGVIAFVLGTVIAIVFRPRRKSW